MKVDELIDLLTEMPLDAKCVIFYDGYYETEEQNVIKPELNSNGTVTIGVVVTEV